MMVLENPDLMNSVDGSLKYFPFQPSLPQQNVSGLAQKLHQLSTSKCNNHGVAQSLRVSTGCILSITISG